jgi:hypothetical protein
VADIGARIRSNTISQRVESGKLLLPDQIAGRIENMYPTEEGTLRAVWGPAPFVPDYGEQIGAYNYRNRMHGIFHALLGPGGERDILLVAHESSVAGLLVVKALQGWQADTLNTWTALLGPSGESPLLTVDIISDERPQFPVQFEATPKGVIIIPQGIGNRAYLYDGDTILPLGYDKPPGTPVGWGPRSTADGNDEPSTANTNNAGYNHTGLNGEPDFGDGRLGTVTSEGFTSNHEGHLRSGSYRAAVQWLNRWGDVSPLSGHSAEIHFDRQHTEYTTASAAVADPGNDADTVISRDRMRLDALRKHVLWSNIEPGPDGTIGRILCRTKDQLNAGTLALFELMPNASDGFLAESTMPDNISATFPDNIPDSWLIREPLDAMPVASFKLYKVAMGVGWAANFEDAPGKIVPTVPGRWGTFKNGTEIFPDPAGREITGIWPVQDGMLVFTEASTFLVEPNLGGTGWRVRNLHPTIGCVAPSSIQTLSTGETVWLGREGFYNYAQGQIGYISGDITVDIRGLNRARIEQACAAVDIRSREYRCWVPDGGSRWNNLCLCFDGEGWRRRNDAQAVSVCTTRDHRHYTIVAGRTKKEGTGYVQGVWVLDHYARGFTPTARNAIVETSWLRAPRSLQQGSPMTVYIWMRETTAGKLTVEVLRDWRRRVTQTIDSDSDNPVYLYPRREEGNIPFWGTALLAGSGATGNAFTWEKGRPFWTKVDIYAPSSETFKLRLYHDGDWEFIGMSFDEVPRRDTMRVSR